MTCAQATNETLSFRLGPTAHVYAVISGQTNSCDFFVRPAESVVADGDSIAITSADPGSACGVPPPSSPYERITDLGPLDARTYDVTWRHGSFSANARVAPASMLAAEVDLTPACPATSERVDVVVYPLHAIAQIAAQPAAVAISGNAITIEVGIAAQGSAAVVDVPMRTTLPPLAVGN